MFYLTIKIPKSEEITLFKYKIDQSLQKILAVKMKNKNLIAIVEKKNKEGEVVRDFINTNKIKKSNPWILIDYYKSKIKFT